MNTYSPNRFTPEETQRRHGERVEARQRERNARPSLFSAQQPSDDEPFEQFLASLGVNTDALSRRKGRPLIDAIVAAGIVLDLEAHNRLLSAQKAFETIVASLAAGPNDEDADDEADYDDDGYDDDDGDDELDEVVDTAAQAGDSALTDPPFDRFWKKINQTAGHPVSFYAAREAFHGGPTPIGAITFIGRDFDGIRAVPAEPVTYLGGKRPAYHGEWRQENPDGSYRWDKVTNSHGNAISYGIPEAALTAARDKRNGVT
jgi:hypothetical protein